MKKTELLCFLQSWAEQNSSDFKHECVDGVHKVYIDGDFTLLVKYDLLPKEDIVFIFVISKNPHAYRYVGFETTDKIHDALDNAPFDMETIITNLNNI